MGSPVRPHGRRLRAGLGARCTRPCRPHCPPPPLGARGPLWRSSRCLRLFRGRRFRARRPVSPQTAQRHVACPRRQMRARWLPVAAQSQPVAHFPGACARSASVCPARRVLVAWPSPRARAVQGAGARWLALTLVGLLEARGRVGILVVSAPPCLGLQNFTAQGRGCPCVSVCLLQTCALARLLPLPGESLGTHHAPQDDPDARTPHDVPQNPGAPQPGHPEPCRVP